MGDPRKIRSKIKTPTHPWQKDRIDEESGLVKEYGIPRKKELWRMGTIISNAKKQVKRLAQETGDQRIKEEKQLMERLTKLGVMKSDMTFQSILGLDIRDILERRLQTLIAKRELARNVKQARQFITHGHIMVNGQKVTSPAYLVTIEDELSFDPKSQLNDPMHPERVPLEKIKKEITKKEELTKEAKKKEEEVQKSKEAEKAKENEAEEKAAKEEKKKAKEKNADEASAKKKE